MERLISIGQITSSPNASVTFNQSGCTIQHGNRPAFHVERMGTMFKAVNVPLNAANTAKKKPVVLSMCDAHLRFGHLSESGLLEIAKKNIVLASPSIFPPLSGHAMNASVQSTLIPPSLPVKPIAPLSSSSLSTPLRPLCAVSTYHLQLQVLLYFHGRQITPHRHLQSQV